MKNIFLIPKWKLSVSGLVFGRIFGVQAVKQIIQIHFLWMWFGTPHWGEHTKLVLHLPF